MARPTYEQLHCEAELKQLHPLVGGTLTAALDGGDSFGFRVQTPDGRSFDVWVDCDPEGNGPGHLNLETPSAH